MRRGARPGIGSVIVVHEVSTSSFNGFCSSRSEMNSSRGSDVDANSETLDSDSQKPLIDDRSVSIVASINQDDGSDVPDHRGRERMGRGGPRCCAISGLVVAIVSAVLALTFPLLYHAVLNYELSLREGTLQYKMWKEPPVPMYIRFYLYNITNARDVAERQSKPVLQQLGPYTFRETHIRVNVEKNDNFTMTFQQRRVWHFEEALSNGTLQDDVTTLNVPLVGAVYTLRYQPLWFKVVFNRIVKMLKSRLFVTKSAIELLFDGYSDPLLEIGKRLPPGTFPPFDKFAWFYQRNNSDYYDGVFNVFTGEDHIGKFGEMAAWNYTKQTNYYESYCGLVNGSFGEGWAPRRNRSNISLYVTDICRTITLDYESDVVNHGVASYHFVGTERVFSNATTDPENWCFCSGGNCNPNGVANISTCRYGAPAFVSFPHYYLADPYYINQVEGLSPNKSLHEFHVDLEPEMAVPTTVRARLQVNVLIEPDVDIDVVSNANRAFVPLIWFEISADLTDDLGWWLNFASHVPVIGTATFFAIFCTSLVAMAISCIVVIKRRSPTHQITAREDVTRGYRNKPK